MPQKHNHINHRVDPDLIRRYLAGELDNKAMHALERQAMDDPFLAEALEGFENHAPDQRRHLADLENRLALRVKGTVTRKVIALQYRWAAAAAILIVLGVGGLWIWKKDAQPGGLAKMEKDQSSESVITDTLSYANMTGERPVANSTSPVTVEKGYRATQMADSPVPEAAPPAMAPVMSAPPVPAAPLPVTAAADQATMAMADSTEVAEKPSVNTRVLQGRVKDLSNNGLAGASVSVEGSKAGALTDQKGNFAIKVDSAKDVSIVVAAVGYKAKKMAVPSRENNVDIAIKENRSALEEVTVTGRSQKDVYQAPVPGEGYEVYRQYLSKNVKYPASAQATNVKGRVRVSFRVLPDGTLEDFKVTRKLQPDCDAEAIRVVKEGPAWLPASDGKATRVQVDVPFNP